MPIIAVANEKGGVGKTTTTFNLGAALAEKGKRVLLIDFDPQASLTICFGIPPEKLKATIYSVIAAVISDKPNPALQDVIINTPLGMGLVPAKKALSKAEKFLTDDVMSGPFALQQAIAPYKERYDVILIDCMPNPGILTANALIAADEVVIPVETDYLAMKGLQNVLQMIAKAKGRMNPNLKISGVLLTKVDNTNHSQAIMETIRQGLQSKERVFESMIKRTVKIKESSLAKQSVLTYASDHEVAWAYRNLAKELLAYV